MNKGELVERMAEDADLTKADANRALDSIMDNARKALENGERVLLTGFGTFKTKRHKARKGRNPQTGEEIQIPARNVAKFSPGKHLKEAVNGNGTSSW